MTDRDGASSLPSSSCCSSSEVVFVSRICGLSLGCNRRRQLNDDDTGLRGTRRPPNGTFALTWLLSYFMMRHTRRVTAFFMTVLFAHVLWVGSGFACVMPETGHSSSSPMATMGMYDPSMAGMDMPDAAGHSPGGEPAHDHAPCKLPWAPDGCSSMTPCAPIALASPTEPLGSPEIILPSIARLAVLTPPSQVRTPDLPPPRA